MKKLLLASSALGGAALIAGPASAADPIHLTVGGFFKEAYMVVIDDDGEGEPGNEHNTDGFFNDAEVHFTGSTVLDNGLEVGARIELEGENDDDQIDEAWIWFSGGFGEVRIGSDDDALANSCIVPPGGTGNFSAFSPNQWGANTGGAGAFSSNTVCTGVDSKGDAQKIIYITPNFFGFQLTTSYTPEQNAEDHVDGVGPHVGMPAKPEGDSDSDVSAYLTYSFEGDNWGLTWGGGVSLEVGNNDVNPGGGLTIDINGQDFYQTGLTLTFGNFAVGAVFEYFNDITNFTESLGPLFAHLEENAWAAGGGMAYTYDAWTFGAQYSYQKTNFHVDTNAGGSDAFEEVVQRAVVTANYALGPGINVDAELGYTWVDQDPEVSDLEGIDPDYDAFEIGLGTVITF